MISFLTRIVAALLLSVAQLAAAHAAGLDLVKLDTARYPDALCMDGSPGAFVIRRNPASAHWVVFLEGGGACITEDACARRPPHLSSTLGYHSGRQLADEFAGILSADPRVNPAFHDANQVFVLYCSSDYWSGDGRPAGAQRFFFQGRNIATAALRTLLAMPNGLGTARDVLFTGASAGGLGVVLVADDLLPLLPRRVHGFVETDAGFTDDFPGFDPTRPPRYESTDPTHPEHAIIDAGRALWGGRGDALCEARRPGDWLCSNSAFLIAAGYIRAPLFVSQAEIDPVQLGYLGIHRWRHSLIERIFSAEFALSMALLLEATPDGTAVFAPDLRLHTEINDDAKFAARYDFPEGQASLADAIGAWFANPRARGSLKLIQPP